MASVSRGQYAIVAHLQRDWLLAWKGTSEKDFVDRTTAREVAYRLKPAGAKLRMNEAVGFGEAFGFHRVGVPFDSLA